MKDAQAIVLMLEARLAKAERDRVFHAARGTSGEIERMMAGFTKSILKSILLEIKS